MTAPEAFAGSHALGACWYPWAFRRDLTGRPVHAALLGEPLVLWRGRAGRPGANSDVCVHWGTALSLGWVGGGGVDCPYHGWPSRAGGRWWPFHRPGWGGERGTGYFFASQPVAADHCRGYVITRRDYLDQSRNSTRRRLLTERHVCAWACHERRNRTEYDSRLDGGPVPAKRHY